MSGIELLAALALPEAAAATAATAGAAGAAGAGALGAGALGAGAAGASALTAAELAALAAPEVAAAGAATAAPAVGGMSGLLSQSPGLTTLFQNTGLLGNVVDATGGLETATTAANNIGGGLLGKGANFMSSPDKLMKAGMLLTAPGQQQQMPAPAPFAFQSQPAKLSQGGQQPQMSDQEKRRRMLMQIFQGG